MSNAALQDLSNRIATNSLTPGQQGALVNALAGIIPTFPSPDELSNSIPSFEEGLSREWFAALYSISFGGGAILPVPNASTLIVADGPTLTAVNVATMLNGQPATVESFGADFSLQPIGDMVVDGSTVLASSDVARVWERGATRVAESAALQTAWFVDALGGNDNNTGLSSGHAVQHKAEIMRRMGTWAPTIVGINVVITYLSSDLAATPLGGDPGIFAPSLVNGATFTQTAALPVASFTGSLLAISAKKRTAGTSHGLRSTFTTTTGAMAANLMLVNATRGNSVAFAQRIVAGAQWQISQPMTPWTAAVGFYSNASEVDTWANGDAITGYALLPIDLGVVGGVAVDTQPAFGGPSHTVQHLSIVDPSGSGFNACVHQGDAVFNIVECSYTRSVSYEGKSSISSCFGNVAMNASGVVNLSGAGGQVIAGLFQGLSIIGTSFAMQFASDVIMKGSFLNLGSPQMVDFICVDAATTLVMTSTPSGNTSLVYGGGTVDANCYVPYVAPAGTNWANDGGLLIGGKSTTAYSNLTTAGVIATHAVALSPSNLDAAAGAAGFGGLAYIPGVGGYFNGAVTPP